VLRVDRTEMNKNGPPGFRAFAIPEIGPRYTGVAPRLPAGRGRDPLTVLQMRPQMREFVPEVPAAERLCQNRDLQAVRKEIANYQSAGPNLGV
jgi:hypothetical protein